MDTNVSSTTRSAHIVAVAMKRIGDCVKSGGVTNNTGDSTSTPAAPAELLALVAMQSPEVISAVLQRIRVPGTATGSASVGSDSESVEVDALELGCVIVEQPPAYQHVLMSSLFRVSAPGIFFLLAINTLTSNCFIDLNPLAPAVFCCKSPSRSRNFVHELEIRW